MTHPTIVHRPTPVRSRATDARVQTRAWGTVATIAALSFVAALTLAPRRFIAPVHGLFLTWTDAHAQTLLAWFPQADTEQALNAVLFAPLGAAIALLLHRRLWPLAVIAGFFVSAAAEYAQTRIPGRVPDVGDILWNTAGAAAGAIGITLVRVVATLVRRGRRPRRRAA